MKLQVHKLGQTSGGADHVTVYEAEIALIDGGCVQVEISSTAAGGADPIALETARTAICRGAEEVLRPRGQGAVIRVGRIVIHPIDFKPRRFELHTAEELRRLLAEGGDAGVTADRTDPK